MKLRPEKRICSSEDDDISRDRLSELPDDVIVRILSCLPIIDAVRTVLLRRFGDLWTLMHTLNFDMVEYLNYIRQSEINSNHIRWFCCFVRNVLMLHKNLSIDKFHLCIVFLSYDERDKVGDDIRLCLRFALCRRAKEITVSDKSDYDFNTSLILPKLTSQFLVTLALENCKFEGEFQVKLRSLKELSLTRVNMNDQNFQRFILPAFLMITKCCWEGLDGLKFSDCHVMLLRWMRVALNLRNFNEICLLGIYHLMRCSKNLEELIIYTSEYFRVENVLPSLEGSSTFVVPQLKTITLHVYANFWRSRLQLVEFLLKTAVVLDKLVIVPVNHRLKGAKELEFIEQRISSFPRASTSARVIFA